MRPSTPHHLAWFWSGRFTSSFAITLTTIVVPFYLTVVLRLEPELVSLVMAGPVIATLFSPLYAGVIADSIDRKSLTVSLDALRAIVLMMLAFITLWGSDGAIAFGIVSFLLAIIASTHNVSLMAGFPDIVGDEKLHAGNARLQTFSTIANSAGGIVGGGVMSTLGPFWALTINAATHLVSCVSLMATSWPRSRPGPSLQQSMPYLQRVMIGFILVRRTPTLLGLVVTSTCANFFIALSSVALLWLLVREIQLQYFLYVVILAVGSLGAAVGATISRRIATWSGSNLRAQLLSLFVYAILLGSYAFLSGSGAATVTLAACVDFGIGLAISVYIVNNAVQQQRIVASEQRGSVGAVRTFSSGLASVCGTASSGALIALFSGRTMVFACGVGLLAVAVGFSVQVFRTPKLTVADP